MLYNKNLENKRQTDSMFCARTIVAVSPLGLTVYTKYVDPAQNTAKVVPLSISAGIAYGDK